MENDNSPSSGLEPKINLDDDIDNFKIPLDLPKDKSEPVTNKYKFLKATDDEFIDPLDNVKDLDDPCDNLNNSNSDSQEFDKNLEQELKTQNEQNLLPKNPLANESDEKSDEELLKLSKEEIIQFKNYQILKLKSYIASLETDKENLINDYKITTENLLERIKELEYQQTGFRPETPMITNKLNRIKNKDGVTIGDFKSKNNSYYLNNNNLFDNKQKCPNCGKEIESIDFMSHSLQCLRKKFKCVKCNILLNAEDKEEHYKNFLSIEKINKAINENDIKFIKQCIEHGFNKNTNILDSKNNDLLIHVLAKKDLVYHFSNYLEEFDINKLNKNKDTPLILSIINKNSKSARELILKGAKINIRNKADLSPLMLCCKYNLIDVAELLIKYGGDVNEKNILGETPVKIAQLNNNDELAMKLLTFYKADISFK